MPIPFSTRTPYKRLVLRAFVAHSLVEQIELDPKGVFDDGARSTRIDGSLPCALYEDACLSRRTKDVMDRL